MINGRVTYWLYSCPFNLITTITRCRSTLFHILIRSHMIFSSIYFIKQQVFIAIYTVKWIPIFCTRIKSTAAISLPNPFAWNAMQRSVCHKINTAQLCMPGMIISYLLSGWMIKISFSSRVNLIDFENLFLLNITLFFDQIIQHDALRWFKE